MIKKNSIRRSARQIIAYIEKDILLEFRVKASIVTRFLNPVIQLIALFFVFGLIFSVREGYSIGYWNGRNFILFLLIAFSVQFSESIILKFDQLFRREKYWKTLGAIMIAPVNRFTLLMGVLASEFVIISVPLCILFIVALILYPIAIIYIFLILLIFFSLYLTFGAMGLIIGVFGISYEALVPYIKLFLRLLFLFSCINYPLQIFPEFFQFFVLLNPIYYYVDLLRLVWYLGIDYETSISLITPIHLISVISLTILSPIISIYLFEKVFKKYGITGY